jgi:hypothetical protein
LEETVRHLRDTKQLPSSKIQHLHLGDRIWLDHCYSLLALVEVMPAVVECLQDMQNDGNAVTSTNAASLLNGLRSPTLLVVLAAAENIVALMLHMTTLL